MKTADLIPFILLELNQGDKYGFELTKEIETKSNGQIVIKQPTLYTLLKKLEKSKFITSYWQDSEIGGKRHYYKLTENGRLQVSTLPSYDFLMKNALAEDGEETSANDNEIIETISSNNTEIISEHIKEEKPISIMDELLNNKPEPIETILPSEEVFAENNIDTLTELDLNSANANVLKDEKQSNEENFANNEGVSAFTQKTKIEPIAINTNTESTPTKSNIIFDIEKTPNYVNNDAIKYVDYINFKNTDSYKYSKKLSLNMLYKTFATSGAMFLMLILCSIITSFTGRSTLYYIFFISAIVFAVFYPVMYVVNMQNFRLKYQNNIYKPNTQKWLYIGLATVLLTLIISIVVNIIIDNNTIGKILSLKNFENLYAQLFISSVVLIDLLFNKIFISKLNK